MEQQVKYCKVDEFKHWKDSEKEEEELRKLWNSIPKKHQDAVYRLMERARNYGMLTECDSNAGEAL